MQTQTHELVFSATGVRKKLVTWSDGEADREWRYLALLAECSPGVAPRPLRRETCNGAPVVVRERLLGEPPGSAPLTQQQTSSLGRALRRRYEIPHERILAAGIGERRYWPTTQVHALTQWLSGSHDLAACPA